MHFTEYFPMNKEINVSYLKSVLCRNNLSPNKLLGQNFLVSKHVFSKILNCARLTSEDTVLEIGAGIGRLTSLLADRCRKVISVEIDSGLFKIASQRLKGREDVFLIHGDLLDGKHHISDEVTHSLRRVHQSGPIKVVANLPYQISSPAIINILEWEIAVGRMCVMLQKEVAERLTAVPGQSEYGPLSVFAGYRADMTVFAEVAPSEFWPQPEVRSALVDIVRREPEITAGEYRVFSKLVNLLFQNRRKMLRKGLKMGFGGDAANRLIEKSGINEKKRPGELTTAELVHLANLLTETQRAY